MEVRIHLEIVAMQNKARPRHSTGAVKEEEMAVLKGELEVMAVSGSRKTRHGIQQGNTGMGVQSHHEVEAHKVNSLGPQKSVF